MDRWTHAEHVSVLAKYASHLDIRLGELESEQRLHQIRTERHIKGPWWCWAFIGCLSSPIFCPSTNERCRYSL